MARRKKADTALPQGPDHGLPCPHHWVLESPKGPVSRGLCERCGEAREFKNYWNDVVAEGRGAWGQRSQPHTNPPPPAQTTRVV